MVVPVFQGSGTRLKIPEAIAFSRPVVSTALGAEGLPLRAGEHFLAADEPESFAAALRQLASGLASRSDDVTRMIDAARAACGELLWPRIAARLGDAYEELVSSSTVATIRSTRSSNR